MKWKKTSIFGGFFTKCQKKNEPIIELIFYWIGLFFVFCNNCVRKKTFTKKKLFSINPIIQCEIKSSEKLISILIQHINHFELYYIAIRLVRMESMLYPQRLNKTVLLFNDWALFQCLTILFSLSISLKLNDLLFNCSRRCGMYVWVRNGIPKCISTLCSFVFI